MQAWADGEIAALAGALGEALPCGVVVVEGDATWIHLVAAVDDRSWVATRELGAPPPPRGAETCLGVGLTRWGRFATLQEIRFQGARDGRGWWVEEERLAGVSDRRLQHFVKAAQGVLRRARVPCLDAAFLAEPAGEGLPSLWELLFDRDPMVLRVGRWVGQKSSTREPSRNAAIG